MALLFISVAKVLNIKSSERKSVSKEYSKILNLSKFLSFFNFIID